MPLLLQLSDDLVLRVLLRLDPNDAGRLACACHRFRVAVHQEELLWKAFCVSCLSGSSGQGSGLGEVPGEATRLSTPEVRCAAADPAWVYRRGPSHISSIADAHVICEA